MIIAICDDEKIFRDRLAELSRLYSAERGVPVGYFTFSSGSELLSSDMSFDVIILDYMMNGINGIDTIKEIRSRSLTTRIVFASSYPDIVFESIKYNIFRFLVKPVEKEELFEALDAAQREIADVRRILLRDMEHDRNVSVLERDIIYAQADNVYSIVTAGDAAYRYMNSISSLQEALDPGRFCRTNRSFLVNMDQIASYSKTEILLKNGHRALISRGRFKDFQSRYFAFLKSNDSVT
ncbi:MAG: response regulator transcription factor [Ruminococcus sp.]|nr:response regulator transcription factor [Ruminococcus sp.]